MKKFIEDRTQREKFGSGVPKRTLPLTFAVVFVRKGCMPKQHNCCTSRHTSEGKEPKYCSRCSKLFQWEDLLIEEATQSQQASGGQHLIDWQRDPVLPGKRKVGSVKVGEKRREEEHPRPLY